MVSYATYRWTHFGKRVAMAMKQQIILIQFIQCIRLQVHMKGLNNDKRYVLIIVCLYSMIPWQLQEENDRNFLFITIRSWMYCLEGIRWYTVPVHLKYKQMSLNYDKYLTQICTHSTKNNLDRFKL